MDSVVNLSAITDQRGSLVALEKSDLIPFDIKRVYYLFNLPENSRRGFHAHIKLQQFAVCINGSCDFLLDNGNARQVVKLKSPKQGLLVDNFVWHEMYNFSSDCILLVAASDIYKEDDYIRNYKDFIKVLEND